MTISLPDVTIKNVTFKESQMTVALSDGRSISVPISWFPRLENASLQSLKKWESCAAGHGIHWEELDEDISVEGLLFGNPAVHYDISLEKKM